MNEVTTEKWLWCTMCVCSLQFASLGFINRSSIWLNIVNIIAIKSHQFRRRRRQHYYYYCFFFFFLLLFTLLHFASFRSVSFACFYIFFSVSFYCCSVFARRRDECEFIQFYCTPWLAGCRFDECAKPMRWNARFAIQWMRAETLHFIWSTLKHTYTDRRRARSHLYVCGGARHLWW